MSAVRQVIGLIETHCDLEELFAEFPTLTDFVISDRFRSHGSATLDSFDIVKADLVQLQSDLDREYREVLHANCGRLTSR